MANNVVTVADLKINTDKLISSLEKTEGTIQNLIEKQKELEKQGKANTQEYKQNSDSIDRLNRSHEDQVAVLNAVQKAEKKVNDGGKDNVDAINKKKAAMGSLKEELLEATGLTEAYDKAQRLLGISTGVTATATTAGTKAMKIFKIALASTGIGLIVVALGSLVAYLGSTQEGIDKVSSVLVPLRTVFQSMLGVLQTLGKTLFDAFSNPKKLITDLGTMIKTNLINRFTALSKIIESAMDMDWKGVADGVLQATTGVEDLTDKVGNAGKATSDFFGEAWKQGEEINKLNKQLKKSEGDFILEKERLLKVFEEQKKLAEDTNKTTDERLAANEAATKAQEDLKNLTVDRLKQEAKLLELKTLQNDTSDEEKKIIKEKLAEIEKAMADEAAQTTELQNSRNSIIKEGKDKEIAAAKAATDAKIRQMEAELQLFIQHQGFKVKSREDQLKIDKQIADKEIAILDAQLKNKELTVTEHEAAVLAIRNDYAAKMADAVVQNAADELEAWKQNNAAKLDEEKLLSEQLLFEYEQRSLTQLTEEQRLADLKLEQGVINKQEYDAEIERLHNEHLQRMGVAEDKKKGDDEIRKQETRSNEDQEYQDRMLLADTQYEQEMLRLGQEYKDRKAAAARLGEDMLEVEKWYAQQKANVKMDVAVKSLNDMITIMGKESAAGKAAAIAATTITTYQSATKAFNSMAGIPVVGPALGAIAAAAAIASGLANVRQIMSQSEPTMPAKESEKKYARGGILRGPRHRDGGIPTAFGELEGGESVMTRKATSMFGPLLSELNYQSGGRRFQDGGVLGGAGIGKGTASIIDYNALANTLQNNMSILVSVEEINKVQQRVNVIEQASRL